MTGSTLTRPRDGSARSAVVLAATVGFAAGILIGFFAGVASVGAGRGFLADLVGSEQAADIGAPRTIDRAGFTLQYPGNWRIDTTDKDYHPDESFFIESPGSAFVSVRIIAGEIDTSQSVRELEESYAGLISAIDAHPFSHWGTYAGDGKLLNGRLFGFRGAARFFAHSSSGRSLIIVTQQFDEDRQMVQPGFDLIERTFRLKTGSN